MRCFHNLMSAAGWVPVAEEEHRKRVVRLAALFSIDKTVACACCLRAARALFCRDPESSCDEAALASGEKGAAVYDREMRRGRLMQNAIRGERT